MLILSWLASCRTLRKEYLSCMHEGLHVPFSVQAKNLVRFFAAVAVVYM